MNKKTVSDPIITKVLIRKVPDTLNQGLTSQDNASTISIYKANQDQNGYINIFKTIGD